jgi:hypothetical protein
MPHDVRHTTLSPLTDASPDMSPEQRLGYVAIIAFTGFPILGALIAAVLHGGSPRGLLITAIGGAYGLVAGVATPMLLLCSTWLLHHLTRR